jgi:protein-S-isoprenylcysteine O-methyltransferase Ste14
MLTRWGKLAQKIRVPVGTAMGVLFLCFSLNPSVRSLCVGGTIALTGGLLRLWAAGHIDKGRVLAQGGPYAHTRNPLYLGSSIMALGVLLAGRGYWLILPFCACFFAFYYPVMKAEELELTQSHGDEFRRYTRRVPLFLPGLGGETRGASAFLWSRVRKNREHRTMAGLLLTVAFLIVLRIIQ